MNFWGDDLKFIKMNKLFCLNQIKEIKNKKKTVD